MLPLLLIANVVQAQWTTVGSAGFSVHKAIWTDIVLDSSNTPYVCYYDFSWPSISVSAQRYNGTSWDTVGNTRLFNNNIWNKITIAFNGNNTPLIGGSDFNSKNLKVLKFNGSAWDSVGSLTNTSVGVHSELVIDSNDNIYIAYTNSSSSPTIPYVLKFDGNTWDTVGSAIVSSGFINNLSLAIDKNTETLYCALTNFDDSYKPRVYKSVAGGAWQPVGSGTILDTSSLYFQIFLDYAGTPYFTGRNPDQSITVMKFNGTSWDSVGNTGFIADIDVPDIAFDSYNTPYIVTEDDAGNYIVFYKFDGTDWVAEDTLGTGRLPSIVHSYEENDFFVIYGDDNQGQYATVKKLDMPAPYIWQNASWINGSPDSTSNVIISDTTSPGSFSCNNITINSGVTLSMHTGDTATFYGDVTNYGDGFAGIGNFAFTKNGTATISGDTLECNGTILVESGCVLSTGGKLRLSSNASNTGRIGPLAGSITGDVTVEAYIPGRRAFRFMAHPFNDSIALTQLLDDIDITGQGGQSNGFTASASTNPSAFSWEINGTGAWAPYTSPTTRSWDRYELLRILIRGAKGEGLNGQTYTPSATVIDMTGELNQGTHVITLVAGTNSPNYAQVGNPYASPVELSSLSLGSDIGSTAIFWSAQSATRGAYVGQPFAVTFGIPAYASFFASLTGTSSTNIEFEEADKRTGSGTGYFKTTASNHWVELIISDSTHMWDKLFLNFDANTMNVQDKKDGVKANNPDMDFYTLSADNVELVVDARPYEADKGIPVGLRAYNNHGTYVIRPGVFDIPNGTKVVLHDKYLNVQEDIIPGMEYWFSITSDSNSQGEDRFEINMVGHPTGVITTNNNNAVIQLIPNPARNEVKVSFKALEGKADLALTSVTGQVVYSKQIDAASGSVVVPLTGMPAGVYMVELKGANASFTQKLIKQ